MSERIYTQRPDRYDVFQSDWDYDRDVAFVTETLERHDGGVVVFDNSPLPPDGNDPALDVAATERGEYARIAHHVPVEGGRLEWREVVFTPDRECHVNSREMTPFDDGTIDTALSELGFDARTCDGYGWADGYGSVDGDGAADCHGSTGDRTVFVAID